MKNFIRGAEKIVDAMELLAQVVENNEAVKEYFMESYGYLDGDDATHAVLRYIEDTYLG